MIRYAYCATIDEDTARERLAADNYPGETEVVVRDDVPPGRMIVTNEPHLFDD